NDVAVERVAQRCVFLAISADQADALEIVLGARPVAALELPHAVILPGAGMLRIGGERLLVPDLGVVGAAELAAGISDQVRDVGIFVMAECVQHDNGVGIILLLVDHAIGEPIAVEEGLLGFLLRRLFLLSSGAAVGRGGRRRERRAGRIDAGLGR